MNAVYRATSFAVCLVLVACGNKGDLYLETVELSAEQKAVFDNTEPGKPVTEETKKNKKKKTDTTQTTE